MKAALVAKPTYGKESISWSIVKVTPAQRDQLLARTNARIPTLAEREAFFVKHASR